MSVIKSLCYISILENKLTKQILTSLLGLLANQPMWCNSIASDAKILFASCSAFIVRTCNAECKVLNHVAASVQSAALSTQLWTPSGECSSNVRFSVTKHLLLIRMFTKFI